MLQSKAKLFKKIIVISVCVILLIALSMFSVYTVLKINGKKALMKNISSDKITELMIRESEERAKSEEIETSDVTVPINLDLLEEGQFRNNGTVYEYDEDLITLLCIGVDRSEADRKENIHGNNGQADAIFLILLNEREKIIELINIPRDIIGKVQQYDENGMPHALVEEQIGLQFAYGDGKEESCQLMKTLVSELMYGLPIHGYAAINMDAVSELNDQIGGVSIMMTEDYTLGHPSFIKGETVQLDGYMAHRFVQFRDNTVTGSNMSRITRQKQYLNAFVTTALPIVKKDMTLPVRMYESITEYMTTDISIDKVTYLVDMAIQSTIDINKMIVIPGVYQQGELFDEYILDEDGLYDVILNHFYIEVE